MIATEIPAAIRPYSKATELLRSSDKTRWANSCH
jgi:hypothetical protein